MPTKDSLKKKRNVNQIFKVPNDAQGKYFIEMVKRYVSPCYSVVCKGRTINHKKCKKLKMSQIEIRGRQNDGSIPMSLADNIGVYLTLKNGRRIGARDVQYYNDLRGKYSLLHFKYSALLSGFDTIKKVVSVVEEQHG
jgi:hypothetical protein